MKKLLDLKLPEISYRYTSLILLIVLSALYFVPKATEIPEVFMFLIMNLLMVLYLNATRNKIMYVFALLLFLVPLVPQTDIYFLMKIDVFLALQAVLFGWIGNQVLAKA